MIKKGGRLAVSDIVTELPLPESITCDASLWAACIGGATQQDVLFDLMADSGFKRTQVIHNVQYSFISKSAKGASDKYGVKSFSVSGDKL